MLKISHHIGAMQKYDLCLPPLRRRGVIKAGKSSR